MKSELVNAGLYSVERFDDKCVIKTRGCNSLLLWSIVVSFIFGGMTWALISIIWIAFQLPAVAVAALLFGSIRGIRYWSKMPRDWAPRLALFGKNFELDRSTEEIRYIKIWIFGIKSYQIWKFDLVTQIIYQDNITLPLWLEIKMKSGDDLMLTEEDFDVPDLIVLLKEYAPSLALTSFNHLPSRG